MRKSLVTLKKIARTSVLLLGAGGLVLGGCMFLTSLPDVRRYFRISTM